MKPPHDHRSGGGRPSGERGQSRGPGGQGPRPFGSGGGPRRDHGSGGHGAARSGDRPQGGGPNRGSSQGGGPNRGSSQGGGPSRGFSQGGGQGQAGRQGQGGPRHGGGQGQRDQEQRGSRAQGQEFQPRSGRGEGQRFSDRPRSDRDGGNYRDQSGGGDRPYRDRPPREGGQYRDQPRQDRENRPFRDRPRPDQENRPFRDRPRPDQHRGEREHHRRGPEAPHGTLWLYGQHAVAAALANPARRLRRLLLTEEAEAALAQRVPPPWPLQPERAERQRLDQMLGRDIAHQGVALLADPLPPPSLQQVLERPGPVIVLDQVTDPRNVGAILRSAAAFGAAAVITQDRNAPEETGALAKAASGALETMPLLRAVNIARTLIALKAANVWCVGLDTSGAPLSGGSLAGRRIALVLGAEGEGLRRLTKETCDELAGLQMPGARGLLDSLNVSAAAAVALYELTRSEGGPQ